MQEVHHAVEIHRPPSAAEETRWKTAIDPGRRICSRRNPPRSRRQARCSLRQAGDCHRTFEGTPRRRERAAAGTGSNERRNAPERQTRSRCRQGKARALSAPVARIDKGSQTRGHPGGILLGAGKASPLGGSTPQRSRSKRGCREGRRDQGRRGPARSGEESGAHATTAPEAR